MTHQPDVRHQLHDLAESLVAEYAGAVPPGQVFAAVFRSYHALGPNLELTTSQRLTSCEEIARRALTERLARLGVAHVAATAAARVRPQYGVRRRRPAAPVARRA